MADDQAATAGGGKLATRITGIVTQGIVSTHGSLTGVKRTLGAAILDDFFEKVSGEIRATAAPILGPMVDHPDMPATMRPLFQFMAQGSGQWQTFLGQTMLGTATAAGLGALFNNELQKVTGPIIAANPLLPMSPSDAARAEVAGVQHGLDMQYEVAQQGLEPAKFAVLKDLAQSRPSPSELLDMTNRGLLNEEEAFGQLRLQGYNPEDATLILQLRSLLIDPNRLADLVTFGVLAQDQAATMARQAGMAADDFDLLVQGNGAPPSTQELLFAYRRGVINRDRLYRGITQGPLRNEWFDVVESFGQVPMSTSDAISASVQGHLSEDEARAIAVQNGLIPSQFDPLFETAGSPPGPQELLHLLNRGIITEADAIQGLKESRLKNKYISAVMAGRYQLPTEPQILSMTRQAIITPDRGRELLRWRGYPDDVIDALIAQATAKVADEAKVLSLTAIRDLYLDRALTADQASARIQALGYTPEDAALEIRLIDEQRDRRYVTAVVTRIHREYVAGLLTTTEAQSYLSQLGLGVDEISTQMDLWAVEQATVRRSLTEAQVAQALKKGVITEDDALARWQAMGYSAADAGILLAITAPAQPPAQGGQ